MDIKLLSFPADTPPFSVIVAAKLSGITFSEDSSLASGSAPTFLFTNGSKLYGTSVLLRYIGRVTNIPNFYGQNAYESSQIDAWLEYAPILSSGSAFESACSYVDKYLERQTFLISNYLSLADVAIWSGLAGTGQRWESLRKSKKHLNLRRWFNSLLVEYRDNLDDVLTTYAGKRGGKASGAKLKDPQGLIQKPNSVNHETSDKGKAGSKSTFEVDFPNVEIGKVRLRFAPEPSGYPHIGHPKAALLNQYFAQRYNGEVIIKFDDTNPAKESNEFVENLLKDIETLDYSPQSMEMAENLIRQGKAYIDDTPREQMQTERMEGIESKNRSNSAEEKLRLWKEMVFGTEQGLLCCLRGKLDMQDPNKSL
ncbi:unnamed protein product [Citrullus colocynthis]|uniref:Glutamyl/glutaminyl-tRNA synthetase class Ib catalytic domain-containing protein n=1 Tax=Citrullus colocynthis TaxID=252529 RepID=A0ABP0XUD6_9ROSI